MTGQKSITERAEEKRMQKIKPPILDMADLRVIENKIQNRKLQINIAH